MRGSDGETVKIDSAVVIGLGSMGRRRIRLMKTFADAPRIVGVNRDPVRRAEAGRELGIETFATLEEATAAARPQVALVCTAPQLHGPVVLDCLERGLDVFMELNLLSGWYAEAVEKARTLGRRLFVAATPVYRREMRYIAERVAGGRVNYLYHCGQYLPDWHPWQDYREFFASRKATNGCREILAVEIPWIEKAFGPIRSVHVMSGRNTSLDIDFPDHYMISIVHENGTKGMYCQDIISRKALRRLEVFSENMHIFWDGTPDSLREYDTRAKELKPVALYDDIVQDGRYNANIIENAYADELRAFFDYVREGKIPRYRFEDDLHTLEVVDEIEGVKKP
jgi:predicted dehydrogenase